jgi:hypothetical protein
MKYLTGLFFILCFIGMRAQFIPANLKLDISSGNHFKHSQLTEGYSIKTSALHNISGKTKPEFSFRVFIRHESPR